MNGISGRACLALRKAASGAAESPLNPRRLLDRHVLFFGGKGGVGKTTLAAAYAILSADEGARTLLVSTDPAHSTADVLGTPLGAEPREVLTDLWAIEIDPDLEADQYISEVKARVEDIASPRVLREAHRQIEMARLSPGAEEAALFERITHLIALAGDVYDRVIFDTAPTGHTLRLLSLPEMMTAWVEGLLRRRKRMNTLSRMWRNLPGGVQGETEGRDRVLEILENRRARFSRAREIITDRDKTAFILVAVPERLPILETRRAVERLNEYGVPVGAIFVNRIDPAALRRLSSTTRGERERLRLTEIDGAFAGIPIVRVPLQESDLQGISDLRSLAASLPVSC